MGEEEEKDDGDPCSEFTPHSVLEVERGFSALGEVEKDVPTLAGVTSEWVEMLLIILVTSGGMIEGSSEGMSDGLMEGSSDESLDGTSDGEENLFMSWRVMELQLFPTGFSHSLRCM